ncbi:hypothetical protein PUN28_019978 [Cardiocondyla obscurior]|uniref:Secreted protein n=1 Tax=Cardiocondyla obscurior TaxID=286306 RepID=A0AAW2EB29_9HYME
MIRFLFCIIALRLCLSLLLATLIFFINFQNRSAVEEKIHLQRSTRGGGDGGRGPRRLTGTAGNGIETKPRSTWPHSDGAFTSSGATVQNFDS